MKRLVILAAFTLAAAGCGSDSSSNVGGPSGPPTTVVFTAPLSPANEVPPVTDAEGNGSGNVTVTFHLTRDSGGNITAGTADFSATFNGFPAGTALTAAHIHTGNAGTNGGIQINLSLTPGEITFPNGSGSLSKANISISPVDLANQIINTPGSFYFNIHTAAHPGGVARGQLVKQ